MINKLSETPEKIRQFRKAQAFKGENATAIRIEDKLPSFPETGLGNFLQPNSIVSEDIRQVIQENIHMRNSDLVLESNENLQLNNIGKVSYSGVGQSMNHDNFGSFYGRPTGNSRVKEEHSMKEILEFHSSKEEGLEGRVTCVKKTSEMQPGEQRSRNYNMPVDKQSFRFGEVRKSDNQSVASCIRIQPSNVNPPNELESLNIANERLIRKALPNQSTSNKFDDKN